MPEIERPKGVHLVGSVRLSDADEVFRTVGSVLGRHVRRIPDGETDARKNWLEAQVPVLESTPGLEPMEPLHLTGSYDRVLPQVRLVPGEELRFGPLGYAEAATASYERFTALRRDGVVPSNCRFQVSLPTPFALVTTLVTPPDQATVEPAYEARVLAEVDEMAASIPHDDLAIQWDTAIEFAFFEGLVPSRFADAEDDLLERLARIGNHVPADVELGFHLCYGDFGHKHFFEPTNARTLTKVANGIAERLTRPLQWIHMPVPRDRDDDAYFQPLRDLALRPETELYLGLVHRTDGIDGTTRRIRAAQKVVPTFGVATECGLGRRPPETIPEVLKLLAEVAAPVR